MAPDVLRHAQGASSEAISKATVHLPFLSSGESAEQWLKLEHLLYSCLTTGDDKSASLCLQRLEERFGTTNEKVQSLRGIYDEACSNDRQADNLLQKYEGELEVNPANFPLAKRRITLLETAGKHVEAATALGKLLDITPTDIEAWTELAELYIRQKIYDQAIYCLEEALLIQPNAWNMHARIGETIYLSSSGVEDPATASEKLLSATRHFCRSVELCKGYLRGYCGLKKSTSRILNLEKSSPGCIAEPSTVLAGHLHDHATAQLQSIIRSYPSDSQAPDLLAAKAILH